MITISFRYKGRPIGNYDINTAADGYELCVQKLEYAHMMQEMTYEIHIAILDWKSKWFTARQLAKHIGYDIHEPNISRQIGVILREFKRTEKIRKTGYRTWERIHT